MTESHKVIPYAGYQAGAYVTPARVSVGPAVETKVNNAHYDAELGYFTDGSVIFHHDFAEAESRLVQLLIDSKKSFTKISYKSDDLDPTASAWMKSIVGSDVSKPVIIKPTEWSKRLLPTSNDHSSLWIHRTQDNKQEHYFLPEDTSDWMLELPCDFYGILEVKSAILIEEITTLFLYGVADGLMIAAVVAQREGGEE